MQHGRGYAEFRGRFPHREVGHAFEISTTDVSRATTQSLTFGTNPRQSSADALSDPCPLKFRDSSQNVHLELAGWSRRVDAFSKRYEGYPKRLEFLEQGH
jgi:hypothetical protein